MNRHHSETLGPTLPVLALLAALACGGESTSPTAPPPPNDEPSDPTAPAPTGPEPQGQVIYAVDDENRLLVFGTESVETVSRMMRISGLPFLEHVVNIDFHPSTGELYGVGSDGRVYTIDVETGAATAVSSEPFTSEIGSFDHFGMSFDPATERIRLVRQGGANWSIDPEDGTAVREADLHYAVGDPNEGKSVGAVGFAYVPPGVEVPAGGSWIAPAGGGNPIQALLYDYTNGTLAGTIDPVTGELQSLGPVDWIQSTTCATVTFDPSGVLWALAPVAALISPELAGAYALVRMSPAGIVSSVVGAVGSETAQTLVFGAIQGMTFFNVATGQGPGQGTG